MSEPPKGDGAEDKFVQLLQEHEQATAEGRHQDANILSMRIMAFAASHAPAEPSSASLARDEAQRCEAAADWKGAEVAYRQALTLAEQEGDHSSQFRTHYDLGELYSLLGQDELAFQEAQQATRSARRTEMTPLILRALEVQGSKALRLKNGTAAWEAIREAFQILDAQDSSNNLQRARALVFRAQCQVARDELASAEADLKAAWKILQPQFGAFHAAGVHSGLAHWWITTARLRRRRNDLPGAVRAWREAVDRRRHIATLPQLSGPHMAAFLSAELYELSLALSEAGEVAEAEAALAESQSLRSAIGLPLR